MKMRLSIAKFENIVNSYANYFLTKFMTCQEALYAYTIKEQILVNFAKERCFEMLKRWMAAIIAMAMVFATVAMAIQAEDELVLVPVYAAEDIAYEPLQYGVDSDAVSALQTRLTELGYYTGNISGRYREGTRDAIKAFQKDFSLEQTGVADEQTQDLLFNALYRPLKYGSSGEDVKRLQERLIALKYYNGKVSGNYLEGSTAGISAFQKKSGLEETGRADIETQARLFAEDALAKTDTQPVANELPGDEEMVVTGDGEALDFEALNKDYQKKITRGTSGAIVKDVQNRLTELGFYTGPVTGNFMNQTQAATKVFQTQNGLKSDGIIGEDTWNAMFNDATVVGPDATPKPTPEPVPVPYAITVDVVNQITFVYGLDENGNYTKLVKQFICSTGTTKNPSDLGDWVLDGRTARWCYFPHYGSHAQYWTRINSSIAFHSVIYNSVDTMDLSIKSYDALGSKASHGCIRLLVRDAMWIYENVGKDTVVTIREDLPADQELNKSLLPPPLNRRNMLPQATEAPTPLPTYTYGMMPGNFKRGMKVGEQSDDVYYLQMKLKELGYFSGTVTGGFYNGTKEAVIAFQKDNGIYANGHANQETLTKLYAQELATPTPEPTATPTPAPIPTPGE